MSLFGQTKKFTPSKPSRRSPLPVFTHDPEKKYGLTSPVTISSSRWFTWINIPLPKIPLSPSTSKEPYMNGNGVHSPSSSHHRTYSASQKPRSVRICVPIPPRLFARMPRSSSGARLLVSVLAILITILFLLRFGRRGPRGDWSPPFVDPNTLVLSPEELASIWEWEILSGHYATLSPPPDTIPLPSSIYNPAVPESLLPSPNSPAPAVAYNHRTASSPKSRLVGIGPERRFISEWESPETTFGIPPRPVPGAIIDLDLVTERCDFSTNKYVRDCLEFLRIGGNLDNGRRVRRGNYLASYRQIFTEAPTSQQQLSWSNHPPRDHPSRISRDPLSLPSPQVVPATYDASSPCDPDYPRIFHMFWAGAFTDKPYMAVLSFLFTQNLGLDKPMAESSDTVRNSCRPQFWLWINPGPAAAVPNPSAKLEMYEQLATNPWSAPFLHPRFRDVVKFKMWNTTEQLDGVSELKEHWRAMPIFNSGGKTYKQAQQQTTTTNADEPSEQPPEDGPNLGEVLAAEAEAEAEAKAAAAKKKKPTIFDKVGTTSSDESDYDRLSVILSDMARFILTHRFGGIYLDADTLFIRDWEELWNYRGQFAYRWSWHQKYNTAVLKLHKGSALSTFLFKTALENQLDFHPMTVSRYLKDANLEKLLFRIPDAVFDPAWLNMEGYQRERPPFPYFSEFSKFFTNDKFEAGPAQPSGFDVFFRGAYSYHFHNQWWQSFDPGRNFPDLGARFSKGESTLREAARLAQAVPADMEAPVELADPAEGVTNREDMDDDSDLSWATVLKRTFEAYLRHERPNAYGEYLNWDDE